MYEVRKVENEKGNDGKEKVKRKKKESEKQRMTEGRKERMQK